MRTISLEAYSLTIRQHRSQKDLPLTPFDGTNNFLQVAEKYLRRLHGKHNNIHIFERCMTLKSLSVGNRSVSGIILTGAYGYQNALVNAVTGVKTYDKAADDAEMEPFFFELYIEEDSTHGILIAQRYGHASVRPIFEHYLRGEFSAEYPKHSLRLEPFMPEKAVEALVSRGRIGAVRFIKRGIPSDIADRFNNKKVVQDGEYEIIFRPKRKGFLGVRPIMEVLKGKRKIDEVVDIPDFHPDEMKVEIISNGRRRTVNFGNFGRLRTSIDITNDVEKGQDGHPDFRSIGHHSKDFIDEIYGLES